MSFTNPRRPIVLTAGLDYYYWPCISGEDFPPAFAGVGGTSSASYSSKTNYPAAQVQSSGAVSAHASATWPIMPWANPRNDNVRGFNLSCNLYVVPQDNFENNFSLVLRMAGATVDSPALGLSGQNTGVSANLGAQIFTGSLSAAGVRVAIPPFTGIGLAPAWFPVVFSYDYTTQYASAVVNGISVTWAHAFAGGAGSPSLTMTTGTLNTINTGYLSSLKLTFN